MHVTIWEFLGLLLQAIIGSIPFILIINADKVIPKLKKFHRWLWE